MVEGPSRIEIVAIVVVIECAIAVGVGVVVVRVGASAGVGELVRVGVDAVGDDADSSGGASVRGDGVDGDDGGYGLPIRLVALRARAAAAGAARRLGVQAQPVRLAADRLG